MDNIYLPLMKILQPIGPFYISNISPDLLLEISKSDLRKIQAGTSTYGGIQRTLNPNRVNKIKKYLERADSTFPNSIILNIESKNIVSISDEEMVIIRTPDTFTILDGQHRLSGFSNNSVPNFQLIITIFIDLGMDQKARIFTTINSEHVKVNKSLTLDLESYSEVETPRKMCNYLASTFNLDPKSPWFKKIKMTGIKDGLSPDGIISQMTFAEPILEYIYPDEDYEEIRELKATSQDLFEYDEDIYILWPYFRDDDTEYVYKILLNYFNAVKKTFPEQWGNTKYILTKAVGYRAIMNLFKDLYESAQNDEDASEEYFFKKLSKAKTLAQGLNSNKYSSSLKGAKDLYSDLYQLVFNKSLLIK